MNSVFDLPVKSAFQTEKSLNKLKKIAREVEREVSNFESENKDSNIGLMGGLGGKILFLLYYYRLTGKDRYLERAYYGLEKSVDYIQSHRFGYPTFCDGLAGMGALFLHIRRHFPEISLNAHLFDLFDDLLVRKMNEEMDRGFYDYLHGSSGIFLYLLQKENSTSYWNDQEANLYTQKLFGRAKEIAPGKIAWESDSKLSENEFNLGLSHGNSSILVILSKYYKTSKTRNPDIKDRLFKLASFILSCEQSGEESLYSWTAGRKEKTRLAWCYGDLGIASALYLAGEALEDEQLTSKAIAIMDFSLNRKDPAACWMDDAGLCHGAFGAGHIFNRFYLHTRFERYREGAEYWYAVGLEMDYHKDVYSGYKSFIRNYDIWRENYGFLEGSAGIGLALISAIDPGLSAWDEFLLLSI